MLPANNWSTVLFMATSTFGGMNKNKNMILKA